MLRRPPSTTRSATLSPDPTPCRSETHPQRVERRRLADQYLRAAAVAEQDQSRAERAGMARVAEKDVAEFERAIAFEPRDAPRDAQRHHLPRRRPVKPRAEGFERQRLVRSEERAGGEEGVSTWRSRGGPDH